MNILTIKLTQHLPPKGPKPWQTSLTNTPKFREKSLIRKPFNHNTHSSKISYLRPQYPHPNPEKSPKTLNQWLIDQSILAHKKVNQHKQTQAETRQRSITVMLTEVKRLKLFRTNFWQLKRVRISSRERERERDEKWDRGKRRGCRLSEWKGEAKEGVRDEWWEWEWKRKLEWALSRLGRVLV